MTAPELARLMKQRAAVTEAEFQRTTNRLAAEALKFCRETMTREIYAQPVPTRPKSGKKMWKRTGTLRRSERIEPRTAYEAAIVNDAAYALPRHEAGKPGHRKTRFPAHWRDELNKFIRPRITRAYRETVARILKRGA